METETIDRLFLELSQVTQATTAKELELQQEIERLRAELALMTQGHDSALRTVQRLSSDLATAKAVIENIVVSEVDPLKALLREAADAADDVGVKHFDTDWLSDEVQRLKNITLRIRAALGDEPADRGTGHQPE